MSWYNKNKEGEIMNILVLPKINASTELILLVKARLKKIREEEIENF